MPVPVLALVLGAGEVVAEEVGEEVAVGLGAVVGLALWVGLPLGSGVAPSSAEHRAPSTRQPAGSPLPLTTKPMVTDSPTASPSVSHFGGETVTCCPLTADSPFHRELSFAPVGRSNSSFQSAFAPPLLFVTTYCAVYPVDQSLVLV